MSTPFAHRHELLFLYEAVDCNPNGDPLDENRPRTDPVTGVATVTDVRIKRTIRDELLSREPDVARRMAAGREILIRDTHLDDGSLATGKDRAAAFGKVGKKPKPAEVAAIRDAVLRGCIDARLFGSTLPIGGAEGKGASLKLTGPVQFSAFNRSLHRVAPQFVQMTAAFAGSRGASQKSFAERHLLPYALIAAYAVANPAAARATGASEEDLAVMLDALWAGTANLATTSKMGHAPLALLDVELAGAPVGRLDRRLVGPDAHDARPRLERQRGRERALAKANELAFSGRHRDVQGHRLLALDPVDGQRAGAIRSRIDVAVGRRTRGRHRGGRAAGVRAPENTSRQREREARRDHRLAVAVHGECLPRLPAAGAPPAGARPSTPIRSKLRATSHNRAFRQDRSSSGTYQHKCLRA